MTYDSSGESSRPRHLHPISAAVYAARSLDGLRTALQAHSDALARLHEDGEHEAAAALAADLYRGARPQDLPTFGGEIPGVADEEAVSWDEGRLLTRDLGGGDWLIEPRTPRYDGPKRVA